MDDWNSLGFGVRAPRLTSSSLLRQSNKDKIGIQLQGPHKDKTAPKPGAKPAPKPGNKTGTKKGSKKGSAKPVDV